MWHMSGFNIGSPEKNVQTCFKHTCLWEPTLGYLSSTMSSKIGYITLALTHCHFPLWFRHLEFSFILLFSSFMRLKTFFQIIFYFAFVCVLCRRRVFQMFSRDMEVELLLVWICFIIYEMGVISTCRIVVSY